MLADRVRMAGRGKKVSSPSLYLDGTTATSSLILVGGMVSEWIDSSLSQNNAIQTNSSLRPYPTPNGISVNSGKKLATTKPIIGGGNARTIIVKAAPSTQGNLFGYGTQIEGKMFDGLLANSKFAIHAYGYGYDNLDVAPSFLLNTQQIFTIRYDGVNVVTGVNKNYSLPKPIVLDTTISNLTIGVGVGSNYNTMSGSIFKLIIYDVALSDIELDIIIDSL